MGRGRWACRPVPKGESTVTRPQGEPAKTRGRISQTAPESKSISVAIWDALESDPGFNEAMEQGVTQIAEGKTHPLRGTERRQSKRRSF